MMHRLVVIVALAACGGSSKPVAHADQAPPKTEAATCPAGQLMHENVCLKECNTDADCGGGTCEQLHGMNEDGTIGPVTGNGCTK